MGKDTSIQLDNRSESFVSEVIASGKFGSATEVINKALRLLEDEELKTQRLRRALEAGEKSGMLTDFDAEEHLRSLHRSHR